MSLRFTSPTGVIRAGGVHVDGPIWPRSPWEELGFFMLEVKNKLICFKQEDILAPGIRKPTG